MLIRIRDLNPGPMLYENRDLIQRRYKYSYTFVDVGGNILALKGNNFGDLKRN